MKSFFSSVGAIFAASILFFSCASTDVDFTELGMEKTPENSVVMIFVSFYGGGLELVQINPAYPAGKASATDKNGGATEPLIPGACYMIYYPYLEETPWAGIPSIENSIGFAYLNEKQTDKLSLGHRIEVPSKPGLYVYYPKIDIDAIKESNAIVIGKLTNDMEEWHKIPSYRNRIRKCFEKASKAYRGTAWESLINEYVEEWSE
ncbi:MAG: hypothetical protein IJ630_06915 [Treponema sp.]|nr:hypothetical protein [Treponema sp.]